MTDDRTKLRKYADAGRPLIEQWLDIGEEFKAIRDAARNDGIDWASVKALIKAEILDAREGTDKRVKAIIEKADFASAYADMLGMSNNLSANKITRGRQPSGNSGELRSAPEKQEALS